MFTKEAYAMLRDRRPAALKFSANWKRLIREDGARIDSNWDTMFQFAATRLLAGRTEDVLIRGLLLELCKVSYERAGGLFNWLEKRRPGVLAAFREDFDQALGEATRAELDSAGSGSPS